MEDEAPKRKIRPQRVKAKSPSKKDIDDDFKLKKIVVENSEVRRNPKRQVGLKNYEEIEEPQDDRYIYCDFCENVFVDNCNKCGQLAVLQNIEVEMGVENRAKLTIPKTSLIILPSPIHGLGVFAKVPLKKGSCLSYGHSCWGAHGKRSGPPILPHLESNRLLLARLIQPNPNENDKELKEFENAPTLMEIKQLLNEGEVESNPLKGLNDYDSPVDILFDEPALSYEEIPTRRFKSPNARRISSRNLRKRSTT